MLKKLGDIIMEGIRESDLAARYSGDIIAVMMVDSNIESTTVPLERIRHAFEETYSEKASISVGIACYPKDATDRERILEKARRA